MLWSSLSWQFCPLGNQVLETRFSYRPLEAQFPCFKIPRRRHLEIEPQRLGLLKVKPSLRNSIFKLWSKCTLRGWSCLGPYRFGFFCLGLLGHTFSSFVFPSLTPSLSYNPNTHCSLPSLTPPLTLIQSKHSHCTSLCQVRVSLSSWLFSVYSVSEFY